MGKTIDGSSRSVLSLFSCAVCFPVLCALGCSSMRERGHRRERARERELPAAALCTPPPTQGRPCLRAICNRSTGRYFETPALVPYHYTLYSYTVIFYFSKTLYISEPQLCFFFFPQQVLSTSLWGGMLVPLGDKPSSIADR